MRYYENNDRPANTSFAPELRFMFANTPKGKIGSIKESNPIYRKDYTNALYRAPKDHNTVANKQTKFSFKTAHLFMVSATEYIYSVTVEVPKNAVLFTGDKRPIPGVASEGSFASSAYLQRSDNSNTWMRQVSGSSFGWVELPMFAHWTNDKRNFRIPTAQEYVDLFLPLF